MVLPQLLARDFPSIKWISRMKEFKVYKVWPRHDLISVIFEPAANHNSIRWIKSAFSVINPKIYVPEWNQGNPLLNHHKLIKNIQKPLFLNSFPIWQRRVFQWAKNIHTWLKLPDERDYTDRINQMLKNFICEFIFN